MARVGRGDRERRQARAAAPRARRARRRARSISASSRATIEAVKAGMRAVVAEAAPAARAVCRAVEVAGKTGTRRRWSRRRGSRSRRTPRRYRPTAGSSASPRPSTRRSRWRCWSSTARAAARSAAPVAHEILAEWFGLEKPAVAPDTPWIAPPAGGRLTWRSGSTAGSSTTSTGCCSASALLLALVGVGDDLLRDPLRPARPTSTSSSSSLVGVGRGGARRHGVDRLPPARRPRDAALRRSASWRSSTCCGSRRSIAGTRRWIRGRRLPAPALGAREARGGPVRGQGLLRVPAGEPRPARHRRARGGGRRCSRC